MKFACRLTIFSSLFALSLSSIACSPAATQSEAESPADAAAAEPSAQETSAPAEEKVIFIAESEADCVGVAPRTCLRMRNADSDTYTLFYDNISGFTYVPGFEYELRVAVSERENPPADASKFSYKLVDVLAQTTKGLSLTGAWQLKNQVAGSQVEVLLKDGKISGSTGVNRLTGSFESRVTDISFGPAAVTKKAGPPELMKQENEFLKKLGETKHYRIVGNELRFYGDTSGALLAFVPAPAAEDAPSDAPGEEVASESAAESASE